MSSEGFLTFVRNAGQERRFPKNRLERFERLERLELLQIQSVGREEFIERHLPIGQSLLEQISRERLDDVAVLCQTVGPWIVAKDLLLLFHRPAEPGEADFVWRQIFQSCVGIFLRPLKGFEQAARYPRMLLPNVLAQRDGVHDRKNPGLLEIFRFDLWRIVEQAPDMRRRIEQRREEAGNHNRIKLAIEEHLIGLSLRRDLLDLVAFG